MAKETIVILHGWMSKVSRWRPLIKILQKEFKVYLPSLPGFGISKLIKPWDLNDYCRWLKNYLNRKKIKKPIILGHSNGGRIAIKLLAGGFMAKKLILIAPAGIKPKNNLKKIFCLFIAKTGRYLFLFPPLCFLKNLATGFFYKLIGEKDYYLAKGFLKPTLVNIVNQNLAGVLSEIKIPTLILWGGKDGETPLKNAFIFKKKIKNAKLIVYKNGSHDLPFKLTKEIAAQIIFFSR